MRVGIIGGGNMGGAFAASLLQSGVRKAQDLLIIVRRPERRAQLIRDLGCDTLELCSKELEECDLWVLAVKPQEFSQAAEQMLPFLKPNHLILSLMAGVTRDRIAERLGGHKRIIRSMPNLPFLIRKGITVYIPHPSVTPEECEQIESLLNACGSSLKVSDENLIDAATAISGNGPAYVFYFIELLSEAAMQLGFSEERARILVLETLEGSSKLWAEGTRSASELRRLVTSRGGTTAASQKVFEDRGLREIFMEAVRKGYERSKELTNLDE